MTDFLRCPSCNMTFRSSLLLEKHREKFCIGGDIGRIRETQTPQEMVNKLKIYRRKKEEEKKHKLKEKSVNNIILFDQMSDSTENKQVLRGKMSSPSDSRGLRKLSTKDTMILNSHVPEISEYPKADWAHDHETQLRYLAEAHSKQINYILAQNKHLEKQRDDIVQRLNEIAAESKNTGYLEKMIKHLNAQEQKNELLLTSMKQQIYMLQSQSMKKRSQSRQRESRATRKTEKVKPVFQQAYIPFYGGGCLSSEISALRLTYLQNGGNDQMILTHLQELLSEAQQMEQREKRTRSIRKTNRKGYGTPKLHLNEKVITLEIENQQLEDELFKLQLQRQKNKRLPKTSYAEREKDLELPVFIKEHTKQKIKTLNAELDILKQELDIQKLKRRMKTSGTVRAVPQQAMPTFPPVEENRLETPNLAKRLLNCNHGLEPAPYDPIAGFVVFYDFLVGLDPSYRVCRLVVNLCSGGQEMGSPSPLPPVYCDAGNVFSFNDKKKQNMAVLATKQAVPRVRPSPNISLIIELQASGGYDPYGQEVSRLIPRGWVKLDIFDYQNRVISGQWKVPIRILPVKPSLTTGALNGVPQLEYAELYVRLVNARDADTHSLFPIDPNNSVFYKYPPLTSAYLFPEDAHHPSSYYSSSYLFPTMQPTYGDNVDSPPSRDRIMTH
ncbi:coiled-coil domain-containing protein 17-like isoform X2 [Ascaphus truei]|uniref:coiled-coil domain-containing protein 17-like isoform X2 n=1 Tax=Ascaphus truei TaxID=8439 RepID=UPI003F5961E7